MWTWLFCWWTHWRNRAILHLRMSLVFHFLFLQWLGQVNHLLKNANSKWKDSLLDTRTSTCFQARAIPSSRGLGAIATVVLCMYSVCGALVYKGNAMVGFFFAVTNATVQETILSFPRAKQWLVWASDGTWLAGSRGLFAGTIRVVCTMAVTRCHGLVGLWWLVPDLTFYCCKFQRN